MTFSIVGFDPNPDGAPEWGVAVASKFLAVGTAVPWARAGVGAVATQALANLAYGPDGLALLSEGKSAQEAVETLTSADEERAHRQLGIVDTSGSAATFTGDSCMDWAGGRTGDGYACQGNILTGPDVVDAMAQAYESEPGSLTERLLAALAAGDRAGGDRRGRQSAAILVVSEKAGYGGASDVAVDLRIDDHPEPVSELYRLFDLHRLYFPRAQDLEFLDIDDALAAELRRLLKLEGEGGFDESIRDALFSYMGTENLEERWTDEPKIERAVLDYLRTNSS